MALRNIFKRKKKEPTPPKAKAGKEKKKEEKKPVEVQPPQIKKKPVEGHPQQVKKERKITGEAYRVLKTPHVTEKATDLAGKNQYVFKIWPRANKVEVKKAIKDIYGVDILGVRIINVPRKKRRLGRMEGFSKGYKKAIVRVKEGQKIEVLPR